MLTGEWLTVRTTLLGALVAYPKARVAVADALLGLEEGRGQ